MEFLDVIAPESVAACAELFATANNAPPWNDEWTVELASARLIDLVASSGFRGILAVRGERIIGFAFGTIEVFYDGRHFCLREMVVAPDEQRRGTGASLLAEIEARLRADGVSEVYLMTSRGNGTSAFYEKNGYACWDSMTVMGKSL